MKALLAFSGGGSAFPGSPVAGFYIAATAPEFLTVCAEVVAVQYSIVVDLSSGGPVWYSDGSAMYLLGGSVSDASEYPSPGTQGGVVFSIPSTVAIYNNDSGQFVYFDGSNWQALSGN